jgi:hypothetical protein
MANKRNKDSLKRREEKRRRRSVARKAQVRNERSGAGRYSGFSDLLFEHALPPKLSAVILAYAEPLLNEANGHSEQEKAVAFAIFCWNASLVSLAKGREQIEPAIDQMANGDNELKQEMLVLFETMHARKQLYYANDQRFAINYHLTRTANGLSLHVISTPLMRRQHERLIRLPESKSEGSPWVQESA